MYLVLGGEEQRVRKDNILMMSFWWRIYSRTCLFNNNYPAKEFQQISNLFYAYFQLFIWRLDFI